MQVVSEKENTNFLQHYFQFPKRTLTYQNVLIQTPASFTINMTLYTFKKILIRGCSFFFSRYFQPFRLFFHTLFNIKVSQIDLNVSEKAGIEPRTVAAFSQTLNPLG